LLPQSNLPSPPHTKTKTIKKKKKKKRTRVSPYHVGEPGGARFVQRCMPRAAWLVREAARPQQQVHGLKETSLRSNLRVRCSSARTF